MEEILQYMLKIQNIFDALQDEESKIIFSARLDYLVRGNSDSLLNAIDKLEKKWFCTELEEFLNGCEHKDIIIFGVGHDGRRLKKLLDECNHPAKFFCDNDEQMWNKTKNGLQVISVDELCLKYTDHAVILGSSRFVDEMFRQLLIKGFPRNNILYPMYKTLIGQNGRQYFDVFQPKSNEVFIDAGAYIGDTIKDFIQWTDHNFKKIYAFEPSINYNNTLKDTVRSLNINNCFMLEKATWSKCTKLCFEEAGAGSQIVNNGIKTIDAVDIDSVVGNDHVTFIKMDVEGSELESLIGAKNTIIKNKPRLAICIYHKPIDVIEIPYYLLSWVPEYKFYIRHYCSNMWETVLYAFVS